MARNHSLDMLDGEFIEMWRANVQKGLTHRSQYGLLCRLEVAPLGKNLPHALSNGVHVIAAKDLARQDHINNVVLAEPVKV